MPDLYEKWVRPIECCKTLTEGMIWDKNGPTIWKADRFVGRPVFYPVYNYNDYYSFSLLSLILHKGNLRVNKRWVQNASKSDFIYNSGDDTIDRDIKRIGGPPRCKCKIKSKKEYAIRSADALIKDVKEVEEAHEGYTNIILCGGKDSLNLLLIPWKNPVLVASASPNYELVKKFILDNGINFKTVELKDDNNSLIKSEILLNCCRNNLEHCRWGYDLKRLSSKFGRKIIFWKGQVGDTFMTPYWKTYSHPPYVIDKYSSYFFDFFHIRGRYFLKRFLDRIGLTQRLFFWSLWYRAAMWQGAHLSIIRQLTGALVLSGYHGSAVQKVISEIDLRYAVQDDVRPLIGNILHGCDVSYPPANPGPPKSSIRKGISHFKPFANAIESVGIPLIG